MALQSALHASVSKCPVNLGKAVPPPPVRPAAIFAPKPAAPPRQAAVTPRRHFVQRLIRPALVISAFGACAMLAATTAGALTLTNRDAAPHVVELTSDGATTKVEIGPSETRTGICKEGCTLTLAGSDVSDEFEGDESVVIQDGTLVVDE